MLLNVVIKEDRKKIFLDIFLLLVCILSRVFVLECARSNKNKKSKCGGKREKLCGAYLFVCCYVRFMVCRNGYDNECCCVFFSISLVSCVFVCVILYELCVK